MIYIRFVTDKWSLESALIRYGTRNWASHVEFLNTTGRVALGSRLKGGVEYRNPEDKAYPITREEHFTADGIEAAYDFGCGFAGKTKYDWKDILGIAANENWHTDGNFICSEFVAYCFEKTGYPLINPNMPVRKITPRDLLLSLKLKKVT